MKRYLFITALLLAPLAQAQDTSEAQTKLLQDIFKCLAAVLPSDWREAEMLVTLKHPGDDTGEARFTMIRRLTGGQIELFKPCADRQPARTLTVELRKMQPADKRGWTSARLSIQRDGKFDLTFDYPKK